MKAIELLLLAAVLLIIFFMHTTGPPAAPVVVQLELPKLEKVEAAYSDREVQCLADVIEAEARGEPVAGQIAVAAVVLNRSLQPRFPKSLCSVTTQPHQFVSRKCSAKTLAIARFSVENAGYTLRLSKALYFHSGKKTPTMYHAKFAFTIGHHHFYG